MRNIAKDKTTIDNNNIFDIVGSLALEKLLDNTATRINLEQHKLADPEDIVDNPPDEHVHLFYSKLADEQNGHIEMQNTK